MSACEWCAARLTVSTARNRAAVPKRFCSDNCRKRQWETTRYRGECASCGGETSRREADRCVYCRNEDLASLHETRLSVIEGMWWDDWTQNEIATVLGYGPKSKPPQLTELRRLGRIGYRYDEDRVAASCLARWAA